MSFGFLPGGELSEEEEEEDGEVSHQGDLYFCLDFGLGL